MKQTHLLYVGIIGGALITAFAMAELLLDAQDKIVRIQEQYAHCSTPGSYPNLGDINPSAGNQ